MAFPGDNKISNLRALYTELKATLQRLSGETIMRVEPKHTDKHILKHDIKKLIDVIYNSTDDLHLKAVVNSVFDSMSVEFTIEELRGLNEGYRPTWYISAEDVPPEEDNQ